MTYNICQSIILLSLIQGSLYVGFLLFAPALRSKANILLALLLLAFMGNLGQYWLRDVGMISDHTLQLIFLPWQIFIALLFWLYVRALQVFNLRATPHYLLWLPIGFVVFGHCIVKVYLLSQGQSTNDFPGWIVRFNLIEEYISMLYCVGVSVATFKNILQEKKSTNYKGFGINQGIIKWIRVMVYLGLVLCAIWFVSLILFEQGKLSNYYALWIFSAVVLNALGVSGIYNSLKQGPFRITLLPINESDTTDSNSDDYRLSGKDSLSVASPKRIHNQQLINKLVVLSTTLSKLRDISLLEQTFRDWILAEFNIQSITLSERVSSNELQGKAQLSEDQQVLIIPYRNSQHQLTSFTVKSKGDERFEERHLYYLKMAVKAFSFHLGKLEDGSDVPTEENLHIQPLLSLMTEEQLFLDSDLDLGQVASRLEISEGYLSKIVNESTGLHFNDWVNGYRVDYAKRLMSDRAYNHYSIEGYGYEAGFNSKSTFYKAFAKVVGRSPGNFKREIPD